MNHARQQIRDAAAALLTGLTTTGARVYKSRVHVLNNADLPALIITTDNEQSEFGAVGSPVVLNRRLRLTVRAVAKASANLDNTLDSIVKEVEAAVYVSVVANTLGGLVKSMELSSIEVDMAAEGELPVGQASMNFEVNYKTFGHAPDIAI